MFILNYEVRFLLELKEIYLINYLRKRVCCLYNKENYYFIEGMINIIMNFI